MNVMLIGRTPQCIAAHPDRPYKTFAEVAADAKARPEKVSFGVLGGSQALVLATLINKENGLRMNLIPYKGGGPLVQDLLSGVTDIGISSTASFSPHIRANKIRPIAVTGEARTPALPRHTDARRAGHQGVPVVFVVGSLRAGRRTASDRRPHACRDHQGGARARCHPEVHRAVQHGSPDQFARGLRRLPEERAGALVQGDQGKRHQG
jgi:hypothetical protein